MTPYDELERICRCGGPAVPFIDPPRCVECRLRHLLVRDGVGPNAEVQ